MKIPSFEEALINEYLKDPYGVQPTALWKTLKGLGNFKYEYSMNSGKTIVLELLSRLKYIADFTTVSGEVDNKTNPERLYRRCGFQGDVIWYVLRR